MPFSALTSYPGGLQLALVSSRPAPPDADDLDLGTRSIVLGSERAGHYVRIGDGEIVTIGQHLADAAGARVRFYFSLDRREGGLPVGWEWREYVRAGAVEFDRTLGGGLPTGQVRHFRDRSVNGYPLEPGDDVAFGLLLRKLDPLADDLTDPVELPAVWLDAIVDDTPAALWVANRIPEPNHTAIPHDWTTLALEVHSTSAEPLDLATLSLVVDEQVAILAGVVQAGFSGTILLDAPNLFVELDISVLAPASSVVVDVLLEIETTGGADSLTTSWSWVWSDTIAPQLVEVGEATPTTLWVWSSEPLADPPGTDFSLAPVDGPGYVPEVLDVRVLSSTLFELTLDAELTIGRVYALTGSLIDLEENTAPSSVEFAVSRFRPDDRTVDVYGWLPAHNRSADDDGSLLLFARMIQDPFEMTLTRAGMWRWILHPDRCPARYLPALLLSYGCPWPTDLLTEAQQRRLATTIVQIFQLAGTAPGLVQAASVLLDLDITVRTGTEATWWQVGISVLGVDTLISPASGDPAWYTFWLDTEQADLLTDDQLAWLERIANTLRGAQEHYGGVYDLAVPSNDFWQLGVGLLGVDSLLGS